jgi:hypothetical protein
MHMIEISLLVVASIVVYFATPKGNNLVLHTMDRRDFL